MPGFPLHPFTEGFSNFGRWMRLAQLSIEDLGESVGLSASPPIRTAVIAVTRPAPVEWYDHQDHADAEAATVANFLRPLCAATGFPAMPAHLEAISVGSSGLGHALARASALLESGQADRVLMITVDSWFDPILIGEAAAAGRLKTSGQALGFVPGEAAACLMFETPASARRRQGSAFHLVISGTEQESQPPIEAPHSAGNGLALSVGAVLGSSSFTGELILDLNGEMWRAEQWGRALVRLGQRFDPARTLLPCTSLGDIGASSGGIGICLAAQALRRGWATDNRTMVVTSTELGACTCVQLQCEGSLS